MRNARRGCRAVARLGVLALCLLVGLAGALPAAAGPTGQRKPGAPAADPTGSFDGSVKLTVLDQDGNAVRGFRWLLEEDTFYNDVPGVTVPAPHSVSFHRSYAPVVAQGTEREAGTIPIDRTKRYFLSVVADRGYTMSGALVHPGQTEVTVNLRSLPLPTGQITVLAFEDTSPINAVPDLPVERGLAGFTVLLEDAGGRYGASAGAQSFDAFGNPIGTTYKQDINGNFLLDADGSPIVDVQGPGFVLTDANGRAVIKNLAPAKYGISMVPPAGQGWQQVTTIEGTKVIDAWIKADEPPFLVEIGPTLPHVFMGFVRPFNNLAAGVPGSSDVTGQVVNNHFGNPAAPAPNNLGAPGGPLYHTTPWIGLNIGANILGAGVYAGPANDDGTFTIPSVPPGTYQLVVWDNNLDVIINFSTLIVEGGGTCNFGGSCDLGDVPVFNWFTRFENYVFNDLNGNGIPEAGEEGIPEQAVNIRWRDGTVYLSAPTDLEGFVPFDEVFPFFNWQVVEVDFARFKATGATIVSDAGGPVPGYGGYAADPSLVLNGIDLTAGGAINPQPQPENGGLPYRVETGTVLTQGFQGMAGQTNLMFWGKKDYTPGENGGISGIVFYSTTRAEDDPAFGGAEPWEPGIPDVTVRLWDKTGTVLLNETTTDNWDASLPTGCYPQTGTFTLGATTFDCFDGLRNFNQIRPGVFDGGYAFNTRWAPFFGAPGATESALTADNYIVEIIPPPGYEIVKEEDRNIDFGETYVPSKRLLPPDCVGPLHLVPDNYSLFPLYDENGNIASPASAGQMKPLCTHKAVQLNDGANAAADFFLFTEVPIAGHVTGLVNLDTANETNPASPLFGEKFSPAFVPVAFRDYKGTEVLRTYTDEFGSYDTLVPSTFTANLPQPSGMSPSMYSVCINDGILPDGSTDPNYYGNLSTLCYSLNFMPGTTTYLDTPTVPSAAFAAAHSNPVDCEYSDGTPVISMATVPTNGLIPAGGPYVDLAANAAGPVTLLSAGTVQVANPTWCPTGLPRCAGIEDNALTIARDQGFGATAGTVTYTGIQGAAVGSTVVDSVFGAGEWTDGSITTDVALSAGTWQVDVTRGDNGMTSMLGVTVQAGSGTANVVTVGAGGDFATIQAAIDDPGTVNSDIILVEGNSVTPVVYDELVILWKPVQLQGWGSGATIIEAVKVPPEKGADWQAKIEQLVGSGAVDLLDGQTLSFDFLALNGGSLFADNGPGIYVITDKPGDVNAFAGQTSSIDGFTVRGASVAGGVIVNGNAPGLRIGNNQVTNNAGWFNGGIRLGSPNLLNAGGTDYTDANNDNIAIHNNRIALNGASSTLTGAGGGISIHTGADNYSVTENLVCGNFNLSDGAGIGHLGLSDGGTIADNYVIYNEAFSQGTSLTGGGIFVSGAPPVNGTVTNGAGSVAITGNLIQGNYVGSGDGGGISLQQINGAEAVANENTPASWYSVLVGNNMIGQNVSGLAGGGLAVQDALNLTVAHNTIAHNDSTGTAADAFLPAAPTVSTKSPAGVVSRGHSLGLADAIAAATGGTALATQPSFSDPVLFQNNVIFENRAFVYVDTVALGPHLEPSIATADLNANGTFANLEDYWDIGVLSTPAAACFGDAGTFTNNILTDLTPSLDPSGCNAAPNTTLAAPILLTSTFNGARETAVLTPAAPGEMQVPVAIDEGGTFANILFGPLSLGAAADLHLTATNDGGVDLTGTPPFNVDFDKDTRTATPDIGADEL